MSATEDVHAHWKTRAVCCLYGSVAGSMAGAAVMAPLAETPLFGVGLSLLAALVVVGGARGARVAVVEDVDGLVVRNPFRTYRLSWSSAVALSESQPWWFKGLMCPAVEMRDGREVVLFGMVAWDRLVSSEHGKSARRFAEVVRR